MPTWLEDELLRMAKKKGLSGEDMNAYVFGTMHKIEKGWKAKHPGTPLTKKNFHSCK